MIYGFNGNMRGGKSLSMSIHALKLAQKSGQRVYCNYPLFGSKVGVKVTQFETWKDLENVTNSIVLFDEIGTSMDSRNFKSKDQMYFTHLFAQMGKLGITFMYTTQRMHQVEKRVRENTDYLIKCRRLWPTDTIEQQWTDTQGDVPKHIKTVYFNPRPFYALYDSFAVVESHLIE